MAVFIDKPNNVNILQHCVNEGIRLGRSNLVLEDRTVNLPKLLVDIVMSEYNVSRTSQCYLFYMLYAFLLTSERKNVKRAL
jgi:hypothetical protein